MRKPMAACGTDSGQEVLVMRLAIVFILVRILVRWVMPVQ